MSDESSELVIGAENAEIEGRIDGMSDGHLVGWALSPGTTGSLTIDLVVDGDVATSAMADQGRGDLRAKGKGDHAFSLQLPRYIADGHPHTVQAKIRETGTYLRGELRNIVLAAEDLERAAEQPLSGAVSPDAGPQARALLGQDGWLFLSNDSNRTIDQIRGLRRLDDRALAAYRNAFEGRVETFAKLGIPYVFAVVPTKERQYHDKLPPGLEIVPDRMPLEQLLELADSVPSLSILDLRAALDRTRRHVDTFLRTDTHWTTEGAYSGYRAITKEIAKHVSCPPPFSLDHFVLSTMDDWRGDLADKPKAAWIDGRMLPVIEDNDIGYSESVTRVRGNSLRAQRVSTPTQYRVSDTRDTYVYEVEDEALPTAVFLRDSFLINAMPFFAEHFRRSVFQWASEPHLPTIELEKPDIVVQVVVERFLIRSPTDGLT